MRKHLLRLAVWSLSAFCALGLVSQFAFASTDDQSAAKALAALDNDWSNVAASKNAERVASFYADDAVAYPPNEPVAVGRAAIQAVWARYFADPSYRLSWKTTSSGAEGALGWTAGSYEDSYKGPDGKLVASKGKYLCVWRKGADAKWKAVRDMWNSDSK